MKDKSIFAEFFGDYPVVRVIDFLITFRHFDYNRKEIARNSSVSWNTLNKIWNGLEKKKIVVKTRRVGKSQMYKLNAENPVVQNLLALDKKLMLESMDEIKKKVTA